MDSQRRTGSAAPLRPGDPERVGSYTIIGRIGEGGMGAVYLGQAPDGRRVAVKVVRPELARDPGFVARFQDEVAIAQRVASFCTAQVLDHGESDGRAFMVTEYIDGASLLQYVKENGELSPGMLQGVAVGVAAALAAIHSAGLIHRDLKPANVLLSFSGPRVIDFGIARALDAVSGHTIAGQLIGSPGWTAPEQILLQPVTTAVDIFTWGCLVAYARNGVNPFGTGDFSVMSARLVHAEPQVGTLSAPLDRLVRAALDKNPRNRPTARDLLLTMVGGESTEAAVLRTLAPSWRPPASPPGETLPAGRPPQRGPVPGPPYPAQSPVPSPGPAAYGAGPMGPRHFAPTHGAAASPAETPTLPAGPTGPTGPSGPTPAGPPVRRPRQGARRAALAGAVAFVLAAGGLTGWWLLGSKDKPPAASTASAAPAGPARPAGPPGSPLLVRIDRAAGWPKKCYGNIGTLTPGAAAATVLLNAPDKCDILPQWSPDHRSIAFTRSHGDTDELWITNANGSGTPTMISDRLAGMSRVAWSPDGTKIAGMVKDGPTPQIEVFTVADPRSPVRITTDGSAKDDPAWCGNRLAFWSGKNGTHQIYTVDPAASGGRWTQVTKEKHDVADPAWSPDCRQIAYTDQPSDADTYISIIGADGTGKRRLTPDGTRAMDASWSPDGAWIAFAQGSMEHPRIWAIRADGTGARLISAAGKDIGHPDWS